jgi:hypothetical protein
MDLSRIHITSKVRPILASIGAILGYVALFIEIGGIDMTSFWSSLFRDFSTALLASAAVFNTIILYYLFHWGSMREKETDKAIEQKEWIEHAYNKLRVECKELKKEHDQVRREYEKATGKKLLEVSIANRVEVRGSLSVYKFVPPNRVENLSSEEIYKKYKNI